MAPKRNCFASGCCLQNEQQHNWKTRIEQIFCCSFTSFLCARISQLHGARSFLFFFFFDRPLKKQRWKRIQHTFQFHKMHSNKNKQCEFERIKNKKNKLKTAHDKTREESWIREPRANFGNAIETIAAECRRHTKNCLAINVIVVDGRKISAWRSPMLNRCDGA